MMDARRVRRSSAGRFLRGSLLGLLGAALALAAAAAAVWPLWYLATHHTALYSILALGAGAAYLARIAIVRRRKAAPARRPEPATPAETDPPA